MDVISYLDENEDKRNFEENIAIKTAIYNKKETQATWTLELLVALLF